MVGLDIQDEMGRHEVGHIDNSMKIPLNQGDGCRFEGEFTINKVNHLFYGRKWQKSVFLSPVITL